MKKFLSLILVLAMVISCISMVSVFAGNEDTFNGVKYVATADTTGGFTRVDLNLTAADVVDGKISKTYKVYNPNTYDVIVNIHLQNDWDVMGAVGATNNQQVNVPALGNVEVTVYNEVVDGAVPYLGKTAQIGDIYLRVDLNSSLKAGDFFILECAEGDPIENMDTNPAAWGNLDIEPATAADLPVAATFIGVKYYAANDVTNSFTRTDLGFTEADVVDGKLTKTYTVINPNDYEITVDIFMQDGWTSISYADANKSAPIPALSEMEFTVFVPVTNGKIEYKRADNGEDATCELNALTLRVDCTSALAKDDYFVLLCDDDDPIYNMQFDATNWGGLATTKATEADIAGMPTPPDATTEAPAGTTPTPVPIKKFENGNAENGMTNWGGIHGGSATLVQPGANGTGNAVQANISGTYHSLAFDLGPAIVIDPAKGYDGAGAGQYTVSFYAKADAGKGGAFNVVINSQAHYSGSQITDVISGAVDTYITVNPAIEMTDEWKKFTVNFEITQKFLDTLKAVSESDKWDADLAYSIALRIDGSPATFASGTYFNYCVDEVELVTPEKLEPNKKPTGITVEATGENPDGNSNFFVGTADVVSAADVKNGEIVKTFKVRNDSEDLIYVSLSMQALIKVGGADTWAGPTVGEYIEIEPGATEELEFILEVNDDNTVTVQDQDVALSKFFYRFDIKNADNQATTDVGTKFTIFATGADYDALSSLNFGTANWKTSTIYTSAPEGTGDVMPVAMIATVVFAAIALVVVAKKRKED